MGKTGRSITLTSEQPTAGAQLAVPHLLVQVPRAGSERDSHPEEGWESWRHRGSTPDELRQRATRLAAESRRN